MAEHGIQVFNDSNFIQIDSTYRNLALVRKTTVTTTGSGWPKAEISLSGFTSPIVAVSSGASMYTLGNQDRVIIVTPQGAATLSVYIFDVPPDVPGDGYGLMVWNDAGQLCFDSRNKYMRVLDFIADANFSNFSRSYGGRQIAVCQCQFACQQTVLAGPNIDVAVVNQDLMLFNASGNSVSGTSHQMALWTGYPGEQNPGYENFGYSSYAYLVLDVTKY